MNVLMVCTGNTCRSPMAEALLTELANKRALPLTCSSAGIFAHEGDAMARNARAALAECGIEWDHRARPLTKKLLDEADLVLAMTEDHRLLIEQAFGGHKRLLSMPEDIPDPFGGVLSRYLDCRRSIARGLEILYEKGEFYDTAPDHGI